MWTFFEVYDRDGGTLYLDLVDESARPRVHAGLPQPECLDSFEEIAEAERFAGRYIRALGHQEGKVVREVRCGVCRGEGPGWRCALKPEGYRCAGREGAVPSRP